MAKTKKSPKIRLSRKGKTPLYFRISPELKARLTKKAEEEGMSITAYASQLIQNGVQAELAMEKKIEETVKQEMEPFHSLLLEQASRTSRILRVLKRAVENPSEDIETIKKKVEEESIN